MVDTDAVRRKMVELGLSQGEVASACQITQAHLSKILSKTVNPGRKSTAALEAWLQSPVNSDMGIELQRLAQRLEGVSPDKRAHVMQFIKALERLL